MEIIGKDQGKDQSSAFPLSFVQQNALGGMQVVVIPGMTLRDYFACAYLSGRIAPADEIEAYKFADKMLKARQ